MNPTTTRTLRLLAASLTVCLLMSLGVAAGSTVKWTIGVLPSGAGQILWSTSSPVANGTIDKYRTVTFDAGAYIDLTFQANPGYELAVVTKNAEDWTPYLDASKHFRFGPVSQAHLIVARFDVLVPTGSFGFAAPTDNPLVPSMVDVTGHYAGITPTSGFRMTPEAFARPYAGDVAMDETGKLDIVGTISGIEPEGGGEISGMGTIGTVDDEPVVWLGGRFAGTRDGVEASSSGSVTGPVELTDVGGGASGVQGAVSYKCNVEGAPFADKNVPASAVVDAGLAQNLKKSWTLALDIREAQGASAKKSYVASALLTLPNGDRIQFPERAVKYSAKKGYTLAFKRGTNITRQPNAVDRKTSVGIRQMTLVRPGAVWTPSGGTISYKFLGQKGAADLLDFVP